MTNPRTLADPGPRGLISLTESATGASGISAETTLLTSPAVKIVAGRYYRIDYQADDSQSTVSGDVWRWRLKVDGVVVKTSETRAPAAAVPTGPVNVPVVWLAPTSGSKVFTATVARTGGTGTISVRVIGANQQLFVTDLGNP